MADQPTPKPMGGLTNREQEILVAALSKCVKSGDIQIDYAKLATETGLKDAKSATAVWNPIKKKLFSIASAQSGTAAGAANKVTKPKTPSKPKEPKEPKTPASTKKAAKSAVKVEEEEDEVAPDEDAIDNGTGEEVEANLTNGADSSPALKVETNNDKAIAKDDDGDSTMVDTPEPVDKGKGKTFVADDMSAGDMSPPTTPAPTKATKAVSPKTKSAPKTPKTPKTLTGEAASTTLGDTSETPVPVSSGAKKRGRKTNAQKEAEAAAAGKNGAVENGDGDEEQKSAKKPRKALVKKVRKEGDAKDGEAAGDVEGEDREKNTPAKTPGKTPVKTPKNKAGAEYGDGTNADADNGEDGQTDKPIKKPRKTPVKKEKKEGAAAAGEGSPTGEAVKEKKKPGPKPGAAKAKKAATAVEPAKPDVTEDEAEQAKMDKEAAAKIVEAAELANEVLAGRKIETKIVEVAELANEVLAGKKIEIKIASTTDATVPRRNWGTPVNGQSPSPSKGQATQQLGTKLAAATGTTNGEVEGDIIVVASEVVDSIEMDDDEDGDTITVASA